MKLSNRLTLMAPFAISLKNIKKNSSMVTHIPSRFTVSIAQIDFKLEESVNSLSVKRLEIFGIEDEEVFKNF